MIFKLKHSFLLLKCAKMVLIFRQMRLVYIPAKSPLHSSLLEVHASMFLVVKILIQRMLCWFVIVPLV